MNDITPILREFGDIAQWAQCPPFWTAKPDMGMPVIRSFQKATTHILGKSAGGRNILAVEYGEKEPLETTSTCLHSALASGIGSADPTKIYPESFYGTKRRTRPVLAIQGAIHGGELTGTVAMINLCQIIETGRDLRGREWPELMRLARDTRILLIPWLNIDGVERWPLPNTSGVPDELAQRCTQGVAMDGTAYKYPDVKRFFPISPGRTAFMGSYYNDHGVNLQYDFCTPHRQPETTAWMEYYLAERPDAILIWHCNAGSMMGPAEYYLPVGHQHALTRLAGAVRSRLLHEGHAIGRLSWSDLPGMGKPVMEQSTATYHTCGGLPLMCELPIGTANFPFSCDEMLDIGLLTIEETLHFAHHDGLRPYEYWSKVRKQLSASPAVK